MSMKSNVARKCEFFNNLTIKQNGLEMASSVPKFKYGCPSDLNTNMRNQDLYKLRKLRTYSPKHSTAVIDTAGEAET